MEDSTFLFEDNFTVTPAVQDTFDKNGFVVLKDFLSQEEVIKLKAAILNEGGILSRGCEINNLDADGRCAKSVMWTKPGNDITGLLARSEKVAGITEQLLGGEVYLYTSKLTMKDPKIGGAFPWHQDYGYWYENGCLFPNMATVWMALDKADKENGCLQIMKGSNKAGRLDLKVVGQQVSCDPERLNHLKKVCPTVYCEMEPGDAFIFHCNTLHFSDKNISDRTRLAYLLSYNRADNSPVLRHHFPSYYPLVKVPNSAVTEGEVTDVLDKDFYKYNVEDYSYLYKNTDNNK